MDKLRLTLNNPIILTGLKLVSPELVTLGQMVAGVFSKRGKKRELNKLLQVIDEEIADCLERLSNAKSSAMKNELQIRVHELLHVLQKWERV